MRKTAIIIVGHMRTFSTCVHTMRHHVFRHYPGADFYISTVKDKDSDSAGDLRKLYPSAKIEIDVRDSQPVLPEPNEPVRFEPYARSVPVQSVLRQLWQLNEAWGMRDEWSEYQTIIRMRPDSFLHSFFAPFSDGQRLALTPWWGRFGGINDRSAIMGAHAARSYFTTYSRIVPLLAGGCPLHPESLVATSLRDGGNIIIDTLKAEFSTLKHDGARPPEISTIVIAHAVMG